jgi:hypothetical protein
LTEESSKSDATAVRALMRGMTYDRISARTEIQPQTTPDFDRFTRDPRRRVTATTRHQSVNVLTDRQFSVANRRGTSSTSSSGSSSGFN